jgi:hypothetical protein
LHLFNLISFKKAKNNMKQIAISLAAIVCSTVSTVAQNIGIGTNKPTNMLEVISAVTPSSSASILSTNNGTTGSAIVGSSFATNTRAVIGTSDNGFGVQGYSNNNMAIAGLTTSGIALSASSIIGYALQVSGNLKFAGGNTGPSKDAVLTSDATGNATWKKSNIAFLGVGTLATPFAEGVFKKVEFVNESYDLQNNFEDYNGGITSTSSVFTAPVAGVYHFSSTIRFYNSTNSDEYYFEDAQIKLIKNGATLANVINQSKGGAVYLQIVGDFHLDANDKVWIEAAQFNTPNTAEPLNNAAYSARFSGHLVTAD